jgi:DNA polymerase phi
MATVEATEATEATEAVQKTQKKNDSLGFYWDLASNDLAKRQKACLLLTKHLMKFKTELHVASKEDIELLPLDIQYALNRLLKGLSSSRDSARQGFSLALTELLTIQPIQTSVLLTLLHEISEKNGSSSGQEERELYFSRIFGYQAIALSGTLSNATSDDIKLMVTTILKFNSKKSYLKSATTKVLLLILENVQTNSNNLELSKMICTMFFVDNNDSAEAVWFFIESQKYQLNLVAVLSEWKKGDMFYTKNKQKLFKILEQSTSSLIHPVFPSLIAKLSEKNKDISLLDFWTFCEENFFNSTHERKYVGFQIFQMVLNTLSANEIPQIFTPNFMRCLINSLSSKEAYLNKCARVSMIGVVEISKKDNNIALALVLELLGKNGHFKFDSLTKTKTIEGITSSLDVKGIEKYLQHLTQCYYDPSLIGKEDEVKKWSVEQMYLLLKQGRIEKTESWVLYILKFIAAHAFFKIQKTDKASGLFECELLPKDFRDYFKDKLMTAVGLLNNTVLKGYMKGKLRNGSFWAYEVFQILVEMENDSRFELVDKLSDAKREAVKVGWKKVSEVKAFVMSI